MSRRLALGLVLLASILLWGWSTWRVSALLTGRLGDVRFSWSRLERIGPRLSWSPSADRYTFDSASHLQLKPNSIAQFLILPPVHFDHGTIRVVASGQVNISAEYRDSRNVPANLSNVRRFSWTELTRFPGGHRLTITNLEDRPVTVSKIIFTAQR